MTNLHTTPDAWHAAGQAAAKAGKPEDAAQAFAEALRLDPNHVPSLIAMARHRFSPQEPAAALRMIRRALELEPNSARAHFVQAVFLHQLGDEANAESEVSISIELDDSESDAYLLLREICMRRGRVADGVAAGEEAVQCNPEHAVQHSGWLFTRNYLEPADPHAEFRTICEFDRHGEALAPAGRVSPHNPDPHRRLRIGYVSPDFRWHAVANFTRPVLAAHDRTKVEVFCYAEYSQVDLNTLLFRGIADHWVPTKDVSDEDLAARICDDRIDILVDLAGHSGHNRLLTFARRPAPIQVSWLGYCNSTGLSAIGHRFTDAECDPPGLADEIHSEKLIRLPNGFHVYHPPEEDPPVRAAPCLRNDRITFGSFNNFRKHTSEVVALWARVLHAVPGSRLLMKALDYQHPGVRGWFLERFAEQGIGPERIRLIAAQLGAFRHLDLFGQVDICLDPFPYNGTTTTCDALWMGVPVVTLCGAVHRARVGHSLLTRIGRPEWSAATPEDYVEICRRLAEDPESLDTTRRTLREQMRESPLCDGPGLARDLEAAYRGLWRVQIKKVGR